MIDDFIVIDDVISKTYQDELEKYMHEHQQWWFQKDITFSDQQLKHLQQRGIDIDYRHGWGSMIYDPAKSFGTINHLATSILYNAVDLANLNLNQITLIRGFMSAPAAKHVTQLVDKPHVDNPNLHYVCLYYVNDSDGDTIIFNKKSDGINEYALKDELDSTKMSILTSVSPKKGRCVLFDGRHYHASTQPTKNVRTVINFNFL